MASAEELRCRDKGYNAGCQEVTVIQLVADRDNQAAPMTPFGIVHYDCNSRSACTRFCGQLFKLACQSAATCCQ